MELRQLRHCCGIGELGDFYLFFSSKYSDYVQECREIINSKRSVPSPLGGKSLNYDLIIATTPDIEAWECVHRMLEEVGFTMAYTSRTRTYGEKYNNILWVFDRKNQK